jgi:hypothetical protein
MSTREPQIFVSHSQYDKDIRKDFSEIFATAGIKAKYMEFEKLMPPAWKEIKQQLKQSEAVFLLLGPNIRRSSYTENWVAFEVGLACAFDKEVWVFEPINSNINFPVPYVTDYVLYNLEVEGNFDYIRGCMEVYKPVVPFVPLGADKRTRRCVPNGILTNCTNSNCKMEFHLHTDVQMLYCPSCRQVIDRQTNSSSNPSEY